MANDRFIYVDQRKFILKDIVTGKLYQGFKDTVGHCTECVFDWQNELCFKIDCVVPGTECLRHLHWKPFEQEAPKQSKEDADLCQIILG